MELSNDVQMRAYLSKGCLFNSSFDSPGKFRVVRHFQFCPNDRCTDGFGSINDFFDPNEKKITKLDRVSPLST